MLALPNLVILIVTLLPKPGTQLDLSHKGFYIDKKAYQHKIFHCSFQILDVVVDTRAGLHIASLSFSFPVHMTCYMDTTLPMCFCLIQQLEWNSGQTEIKNSIYNKTWTFHKTKNVGDGHFHVCWQKTALWDGHFLCPYRRISLKIKSKDGHLMD